MSLPSQGLAGTAMTAAIMGNAPIATRREEEHLILERIDAEGPAMAQDYWLSIAQSL
jgi:hypothetical protein